MNLKELTDFIAGTWKEDLKRYGDFEFIDMVKKRVVAMEFNKNNIEYQKNIIKEVYLFVMKISECIPRLTDILNNIQALNMGLNLILNSVDPKKCYKTNFTEEVVNRVKTMVNEENKTEEELNKLMKKCCQDIIASDSLFNEIKFDDVNEKYTQYFVANVLYELRFSYLALDDDPLYLLINNSKDYKERFIFFNDSQSIVNKKLYIKQMKEAQQIINTNYSFFNYFELPDIDIEKELEDEIFKFRIKIDKELAHNERISREL